MIYTQLVDDYKYDTIAEAIYAREVEYFHYDFDRVNFEYLIAKSDDPEFVTNVRERLNDTAKQMNNVMLIIEALKSQIDNHDAYNEAVARAIAKRKEKAG